VYIILGSCHTLSINKKGAIELPPKILEELGFPTSINLSKIGKNYTLSITKSVVAKIKTKPKTEVEKFKAGKELSEKI
jgi:hypothetical protein